MARFVWNGTEFVDRDGNPLVDPSAPYVPVTPQIIRDIPEYASPVSGKMITSRSERRYDLEASNSREWDPADSPTKGKFRNERIAKKAGAKVDEEFRDLPMNQEFRAGVPTPKPKPKTEGASL